MPTPNRARVPLTALSRELTAFTGEPAPSYRRLWNMIVNGELPPVEKVDGQYETDRSNLSAIAGLVGMTVPVQPAAEEQETGHHDGETSAAVSAAQPDKGPQPDGRPQKPRRKSAAPIAA